MNNVAAKLIFVLFLLFFQMHATAFEQRGTGILPGCAEAFASQEEDRPDIEWFRREMGISPKYLEHESGVMGLSWAHFIAMVFLVLSLVVALLALYLRYSRTKELLRLILEEEKQSDREG